MNSAAQKSYNIQQEWLRRSYANKQNKQKRLNMNNRSRTFYIIVFAIASLGAWACVYLFITGLAKDKHLMQEDHFARGYHRGWCEASCNPNEVVGINMHGENLFCTCNKNGQAEARKIILQKDK